MPAAALRGTVATGEMVETVFVSGSFVSTHCGFFSPSRLSGHDIRIAEDRVHVARKLFACARFALNQAIPVSNPHGPGSAFPLSQECGELTNPRQHAITAGFVSPSTGTATDNGSDFRKGWNDREF